MIIFHALAVLILLLLFIFRLSRAFCWFYDWFFRVLGGDGSAIDCHLERASGGAFHTPSMSSHVESVPWCNFLVYLKMEKFSVRCFRFSQSDMWCNNAWAEAETRSKVERKRISFIKSFLDGSLKALERFSLVVALDGAKTHSAELSIFFFPPSPSPDWLSEIRKYFDLFRHSLIIIKS